MSPSPPIRRVRSTSPKPPEPAAPAPPDTFPAGAILTSFDSWVANTSQKYGVPAEWILGLVHVDTDPRARD
jgi:hypothetical protein